MMNTRLGYLLIGCVIGFILGYIVRSIKEIKEKVEEVDKHVLGDKPKKASDSPIEKDPKDKGALSSRAITNIGMLLVVGFTVWAAIFSQSASNDVKKQQHRQDNIVKCDQRFLAKTIAAANARTQFSVGQSQANIDLQKAFNKVVQASLQKPPLGEAAARKVVEDYAVSLQTFLRVSGQNQSAISTNPYPKVTDLLNCINTN